MLTPHESRVLGVLLEKAHTTPGQYPLTLNAILSGCNQKSIRHPVTSLTEDDALLNARLARILTIDDYDTKQQTPKLWTPQEAFAIDNGATVQDESD